jgi:hypothetical protein
MVKTFFVLVLLIIIGCVPTQTVAPTMPEVTSQQGKACLRECQAINANCVNACSIIFSRSQRGKCLNNCNKKLGDCYSTCE